MREVQSTRPPPARTAFVQVTTADEAALISVGGLVDENFAGFGDIGQAKTAVIDVSQITRMTSFGVRQWLKAIDKLQQGASDLYLLGCPTFFVDQLNMVLNFGGGAKVLTVVAPYVCNGCSNDSAQIVDVAAERANLTTQPPEKQCPRCGEKLELDEMAESYFAFAAKYAPTRVHPAAAELLASKGLYASTSTEAQKPPRIIKLVHGSVTYFRIIGAINSQFRARPFITGAEGEVVIDLAEVSELDISAVREWRRLLKTLAGQVSAVTLVDVGESMLAIAGDTLAMARNIAVASLRARYQCQDCKRSSEESESLTTLVWPPVFEDRVCSTCGGATVCQLAPGVLNPLQKASTQPPRESAKVVEARREILSRALTNASVAQAGAAGGADTTNASGDTILGKYQIVRRLSGGGMADVFLAKQTGLGGFEKPVALKRIQSKLLENRQQAIELFLNEAKIAGRLTHPNIVQVLDVGEVGGALYLAMEYVRGRDLRDIAKLLQKRGQRLPLNHSCYIAREVALALDHAYWSTDMNGKRLSVVHRDISPHNVILGYDGTVKLLDFGVAVSSITETEEKLVVGKWTYMAPETALSSVADHRSDLFSLGVVLYLLCCGAIPFGGTKPKEILTKIKSGQFIPVTKLAPEVPEPLAVLITRLLSASPEHRPQRGQEVVAELDKIMRENALESSGRRIAELLTELFPEDPDRASVKDVVRVARDGDDTRLVPPTAGSITPSAGTGYRSNVDISHSFQRVGGDSTPGRRSQPIPIAVQIERDARDVKEPPPKGRNPLAIFVIVVLVLAMLAGLAELGYFAMTGHYYY